MINTDNFDTQYARFEGEDIHISRAESGRRGYTCIGCTRPLEAVIQRKNPHYKSFFRHIVDSELKEGFHCSFNSRKYLERVVEKIIIEKGSILLPKLIKYPPLGSSHPPLLLQEERELIATKAKAQQTIFLEHNSHINASSENENLDKKKYIRPDVIFYDENYDPILFIEIVITHPIDDKKKAKLINLGINTIQIDLPHGSKDELKELIEAGTNTKWVFNNEEFYTDYFSISGENRREFPSINEHQREIFQESSICRRARIRELIYSIERCMETDQFREIEENLGAEVNRIGELAESAKARLAEMEAAQETGLYSEFETEEKEVSDAETGERNRSERIAKEQKDLEERYTRKAEQLREEESAIRRRERNVFGAENPYESLPKRTAGLENDIERLKIKGKNKDSSEIQAGPEEKRIDEQLAEFDRIETRLGL